MAAAKIVEAALEKNRRNRAMYLTTADMETDTAKVSHEQIVKHLRGSKMEI